MNDRAAESKRFLESYVAKALQPRRYPFPSKEHQVSEDAERAEVVELRRLYSLLRRLGIFAVVVTVLFVIPACLFLIWCFAGFIRAGYELEKMGIH